MTVSVSSLLSRGDEISIELGRLVIRPASGKHVPQDWLRQHSRTLLAELLAAKKMDAYEYLSYSTGRYGRHKIPGVTLQFQAVATVTNTYAIFNASLTRSRNTKAGKKGSPLPDGQFHLGKRSHLYRLWQSTKLSLPRRLSSLHDYMGNLQGILFTAEMTPGHRTRLDAGSLLPLSISPTEVRNTFKPDSERTTTGQIADSCRTKMPDKDLPPAQKNRGFRAEPTTGEVNRGKTAISTCEYTGVISSAPLRKRPEDQTVQEWRAEYSSSIDDYTERAPYERSRQWN